MGADVRQSDDIFIEDIRAGMRVVVRGNGGSGKTLFLKYFWNRMFDDPRGAIPVFIELRKFNDFHSTSLEAFIKFTITNGKDIDDKIFEYLLRSGSLVIMLDGFDEIIKSKRRDIEKQVLSLEEKCPKCPLIVSSRANEMFDGWTNFHIYDVVGFNIDQVRELVNKSTVLPETKKAFLKVLNDDFYNEHQTFLEIPLLALMMLITFRDTASIPANIDAFYSAVFMTLYQNHDAMKESLDREKSLGLVELQRFFAVFCFLTYIQEKYEFSKIEILEQIHKTSEFLNKNPEFNAPIKASPESILEDIEEAVNLICQDGLSYVFVHRSFQEYFTAYFIIKMEDAKTGDLLAKLGNRFSDSVLKICYQMKPASVTAKYIVPKYERFLEEGAFLEINNLEDAKNRLNFSSIYIVVHNHPHNLGSNKKATVKRRLEFHIGHSGHWRNFTRQLIDLELYVASGASTSEVVNELRADKIFTSLLNEVISKIGALEVIFNLGESSILMETVVREGEDILSRDYEDASSVLGEEAMPILEEYFLKISRKLLDERLRTELLLKGFSERQKQTAQSSISDIYNL